MRSIVPDTRRAWVATVAVALANGTAFGTTYTFGTFFRSMADEFGSTRGSTSLMFGVTLLCFFGFGLFTGPLSDRIPAHRLLAVGGVLFVSGLLLTSRVHHLVLGYVTYGVGVGLGSGCFIAPLTALVGRSFTRRRALALGITAAGNGLGTLLLVPLAARLIHRYGWRTTYVALAAIGGTVFLLAFPAVREDRGLAFTGRAGQRALDPRPALAHLRDHYFRALFGATLLMATGLYVAFAYIVPFAEDDGVASGRAAGLVALIGLSSVVGRLFLTNLTDRLAPPTVFRGALVLQIAAYVVWLVAGGHYPVLVLFALVLGVGYGGFVAIGPEMIISRFGFEDLGARMGVNFLAFGLGGLVGPPVAGYVADATHGQVVPIAVVIALVVGSLGATLPLARRTYTPVT